MGTRTTMPVLLVWIWLAFIAAVAVVYRAFTQSLTIDEAYVFQLFLAPGLKNLFRTYDAAYHVLHTWASWLSVHWLGSSEIAIRLPSVVAGIFYLAGVGVLCRRMLGDGWRYLAGVMLLTANPLVLDYLSISRGYGAALAFFIWGLDALLEARLIRAGVLFGFSAACNLTMAVPIFAACAIFVLLDWRRGNRVLPAGGRLLFPFVLVAAPILAVPLRHARSTNFYYGAEDLGTSLNSLIAPSLAFHSAAWPPWTGWVEHIVLPALVAGLVLATAYGVRRADRAVVLAVSTLLVSLLILIAAHACLGVLYPWSRTGLYLIWLFQAALLATWASRTPGWLSRVFGGVATGLAVLFLLQFQTRFYYDFRDDADMRSMMQRLAAENRKGAACIGGSWQFEPTVNYYRARSRLDWLQPMVRTDAPQPGCEYFMLLSSDARFVEQFHLRRLYTGPVSGAILAQRMQ